MESEGKQRTQRNRLRRERAARMQQQQKERQASPGEEGDESPGRDTPQRPPLRKKRSKEPIFEEDIIDGFAIISFRTYEDLESTVKNLDKNNCKLAEGVNDENPPDTGQTTPPPLHRPKKSLKNSNKKNHTFSNKVEIAPCPASGWLPASLVDWPAGNISHVHNTLHSAGGTSDDTRTEDEINDVNGPPPRSDSRERLSDDASSHTSSGRGYICDSESEDDRISDADSDLFTTAASKRETPNHHKNNILPNSALIHHHSPVVGHIPASPSPLTNLPLSAALSNGPRVPETPTPTPSPKTLPPPVTSSPVPVVRPVTPIHHQPLTVAPSPVDSNSLPLTGVAVPPTTAQQSSVQQPQEEPQPPPPPPPPVQPQQQLQQQHHQQQQQPQLVLQQQQQQQQHQQHQQPQHHHHLHQGTSQHLAANLQQANSHRHRTSSSSSSSSLLQQPLPSTQQQSILHHQQQVQQQIQQHQQHQQHQQQHHHHQIQNSHHHHHHHPASLPLVAASSHHHHPHHHHHHHHHPSTQHQYPVPARRSPTPTPPLSAPLPPPVTTALSTSTTLTTTTTSSTTPASNSRSHSPRGHSSPSTARDSHSYSSNISSLSRSSVTPSSGSSGSLSAPYTNAQYNIGVTSLSFSKASTWGNADPTNPPHDPHISPAPPPRPTPPPAGPASNSASLGISLHNNHHHASPFSHPHPPSPLHPHGPVAAHPGMFAPPIPPSTLTPSSLPLGGTGPTPFGAESLFSQTNQADLLRRELDSRFLASHDRTLNIPPPPYMRTEMHQHQHNHTHLHQHSHLIPPTLGNSLVPPPSPHLIPKLDSPFYRQGLGLATYPGLSALLPPSGSAPASTPFTPPNHLAAFQPKMNPLVKGKNMKSGRWCAMHVRIAWEIYNHQQKAHADAHKGNATKPADLIRPPNHLFPSLHRPHHDLTPLSSSLLGTASSHPRTPFEANPHHNTFLNPNPGHLGKNPVALTRVCFPGPGVSPFARPAYPGFGGPATSFGGLGALGNSMFGSRDLLASSSSPAHDQWNRLHRLTGFPAAPGPQATWPLKSELERQRDEERERDRERERERDREREKERDREQQRKSVTDLDKERREKEFEKTRELEREKEREKELERQKERDRENRALQRTTPLYDTSREHRNGDDLSRPPRDRDRLLDSRRNDRRDNSRSPIRNNSDIRSRDTSAAIITKNESAFDSVLNAIGKPMLGPTDVRIKEEPKKDDDVLVVSSRGENLETRDRHRPTTHEPSTAVVPPPPPSIGNEYLSRSLGPPPPHMSMLDRNRMLSGFGLGPPPPPGPAADRNPVGHSGPHPPLGVWSQEQLRDAYRGMELHRLEMERERQEQLLHRYNPLAAMMLRDREQDIRRHLEEQYSLERERQVAYERSKQLPQLRPPDHQPPPPSSYLSAMFPQTMSPLVNNMNSVRSKSNSPLTNSVGIPPPLIPSAATANQNHHHATSGQRSQGNSPAVHNKMNAASGGPLMENSHENVHHSTKDKKDNSSSSASSSSGTNNNSVTELESQSR